MADKINIEECRAICDMASEGPWEPVQRGNAYGVFSGQNLVCTSECKNDNIFIAFARKAMPVLVEEIESLRAECGQAKKELDEYENMTPEQWGEFIAGL